MLRSVVIEVRQHLCCANVFLNFIQSVANSETLKINVEKNLIRIKDGTGTATAELNVEPYFTLLTDTFSNLLVDGENVAFRISILDIKHLDGDKNKLSADNVKFTLKENEEVTIHCRQCEATLCEKQKYGKIREFPSGAIDVGEFFCHHGPSFSDVLLPRLQDMFYGFLFIVVNMENVEKSVKLKEHHVYCKRCKRYLGETVLEGKALKMWNESIAIKKLEKEDVVDLFQADESNMPVVLMHKVIKETSLPSPEPLLRNMHFTKVVLEAVLPNREHQFLLVHIMEKCLPVLKNAIIERFENDLKPSQKGLVNLENNFAFKILYRHIEAIKETDDAGNIIKSYPTLFDFWQQDINILKMNISPFLFQQLLDDLNCNSLCLPDVYRDNKDQFTLSYIFQ